MSESKMVTEREAVLRERQAFWNGMIRGRAREFQTGDEVRFAAAKAYPLPSTERPRVVVDHWGIQWRCVDGAISAADDGKWVSAISEHSTTTYYCVNTERVRIWSDLLANPTELVEDTP